MNNITPTGKERFLSSNDLIVTKTDTKGLITYANDVFLNISEVKEEDALGKPHNFIRHPDMPSGVFKLMWETLGKKEELFAYVKNLAFDGSHYWVLAHVTPSFNKDGKLVGYHSMRRSPSKKAISTIEKVYSQMLLAERGLSGNKRSEASLKVLEDILVEEGLTYSQWVWRIVEGK